MTVFRTILALSLFVNLAPLALAQPKPPVPKPTPTPTQSLSLSDMLENRLRGVVTVEVMDRSNNPRGFFGIGQNPAVKPKIDAFRKSVFLTDAESTGSGFVIRRNGELYIVTNCHVVEKANDESEEAIYVSSLTGERYRMKLVGADTIRDIAVLKFEDRPGKEFQELAFRSAGVRVGERVYALGTPLGKFPSSVTEGIVSGLNRQVNSTSSGYIQSSALLSPGNSGGPLIDARGAVVGVNTRSGGKSGNNQLSFSLHSTLAQRTVEEIIAQGRVRRGSLGLEITSASLLGKSAFVISSVLPGTPEPVRKRLEGNILTHVQGIRLSNSFELFAILDQIHPGEEVKLQVEDDKKQVQEVALRASELTDERLAELVRPYLKSLGIEASETTGKIQLKISEAPRGEAAFVVVSGGKSQPSERIPAQMVPVAAGWLDDDDDDHVLYPLQGLRSLHLIVRRMAVEGRLMLAADEGEKSVGVLGLQARVGIIPIQTVLH